MVDVKKGHWMGKTLYLPNVNQLTYLEKILEEINKFSESLMIVEVDFNLTLEPELDATSQKWILAIYSIYKIERRSE